MRLINADELLKAIDELKSPSWETNHYYISKRRLVEVINNLDSFDIPIRSERGKHEAILCGEVNIYAKQG